MESEMKCNMSEMWRSKMPQGLDLEVTHHPLTMRRVVNLIIAMERLKGFSSESLLSTEFTDDNLLNMVLENVVEEKIVFERGTTPAAQYSRRREVQCSVTDSEKRSLVVVPNSMELHAVMLQGGSDRCKVHLNMSTYLDRTPSAEAQTVALGIKGTNYYLSCHKDGEEPTLHLEAVDKASLANITSDSDMVRFLFYKQDSGLNISTLMSVPFSNWYISTAEENNRPVQMCQETARRHRAFNIDNLKVDPTTEDQVCPILNGL
ncbi:interleukin-1 beta-like [Morone saxatilis]|uniref:interleukin-1 beta-like n=1 Tax=Morone saxatilis TaxID=34816 RepID=UPI0015E21E4D|nr:interleukin-1 beta-like [Morone saxatilis]XP_035514460.1 interleukin-1 beta-like [Morone saxatilis]